MQYPTITIFVQNGEVAVYVPTGLELPIMLVEQDGDKLTGARVAELPSSALDPEVEQFVQHMLRLERSGELDMTPKTMETQSFKA